MKKRIVWLLCVLSVAISLGILLMPGCSQNNSVKSWGGSMQIKLPQGMKFINATWKENQLWYLYRPMHAGEQAETTVFQEKSEYGVFEGKVEFVEIPNK